ncbi:MAG: ABC transporter substrate-binding protein [Streptococcus sp.]|nr:ABC transporter substrate-binding protein [Streptococcus sp.]
MKLKKFTLGAVVAAILAGCGNAADSNTVKIGGNFELTGNVATYGTSMNNGAQLAVEQKGKLLDKELKYVSYDNKSDKTEVASVAKKLASEKVVGVVGPATTGDASVSIPVNEQAKIPTVFPATTGDGVTLKNAEDASSVYEYIYRVCFSDSYQGVVGANFVHKKFGNAKVAILQDTGNDYSKGLADAFEKTYTDSKIGGTVVAREYYQSKDTDFQAVLTTLKSKDFDVLYVPGYYEEVGLIIKQAREIGITQPIVGGDGLSSDKLAALAGNSSNLSNVYYTSHFSTLSDDADVQAFVQAYKEKYGTNPDTFAALSYDATQLLMKAIETAGSTDPQAITKALAATKDFDGVTGTFSMGPDHTPVKSAVVIEFQNGQEVSAQEYSAD